MALGGLVGGRLPLGLGGDGRDLVDLLGADLGDPLGHVGAVVDLGDDRQAGAGCPASATSWRCRSTLSRIQVFDGFEAVGDDLLGDLRGAGLVQLPGRLGAAGLDHHDGHVAVVELATGDDQLEGRRVALLVGGMGHPLPSPS